LPTFEISGSNAIPDTPLTVFRSGIFYDIAMLDVNMPGINGMELLAAIRQHSPNTACVMITGQKEVIMAVECLQELNCAT
jgi:DNA-binding NtrC family response regulator